MHFWASLHKEISKQLLLFTNFSLFSFYLKICLQKVPIFGVNFQKNAVYTRTTIKDKRVSVLWRICLGEYDLESGESVLPPWCRPRNKHLNLWNATNEMCELGKNNCFQVTLWTKTVDIKDNFSRRCSNKWSYYKMNAFRSRNFMTVLVDPRTCFDSWSSWNIISDHMIMLTWFQRHSREGVDSKNLDVWWYFVICIVIRCLYITQ